MAVPPPTKQNKHAGLQKHDLCTKQIVTIVRGILRFTRDGEGTTYHHNLRRYIGNTRRDTSLHNKQPPQTRDSPYHATSRDTPGVYSLQK